MTVCCLTACGESSETSTASSSESSAVTTADTTTETTEATTETVATTTEAIPVEKGGEIALGTSDLSIITEKKFEKGEMSAEDTDENQVAYYKSAETLVDFDVYQWAKSNGETLKTAIAEEAKKFSATPEEKTINGLSVASYKAKEESDGKQYDTVTYMIDDGDYFVELVFWLDGDNAQAEVDAIMATLSK